MCLFLRVLDGALQVDFWLVCGLILCCGVLLFVGCLTWAFVWIGWCVLGLCVSPVWLFKLEMIGGRFACGGFGIMVCCWFW